MVIKDEKKRDFDEAHKKRIRKNMNVTAFLMSLELIIPVPIIVVHYMLVIF